MKWTALESSDPGPNRNGTLRPPGLPTGSRVRVVSGPFEHVAGIVEGERAERGTLVRIEVLGRPVILELQPSILELVATFGPDT